MKLRLSPKAVTDIQEISSYVRGRNPPAAVKVRDAIFQTLDVLTRNPYMGRQQRIPGVRKCVSNKYPYLIFYLVDEWRRRSASSPFGIRHK